MPADAAASSPGVPDLRHRIEMLEAELRVRTAERDEAAIQQAATSEVLQVINSSPGELGPVFDAMLESATRLCDAAFGILWLCDGEHFHAAALHGVLERYAEIARVPVRPSPNNPLGRMLRGERVIVSVDAADDELYRTGEAVRRALVDVGGARSFTQVALAKDTLLGSLTVYRIEARAFSENQIALLKTFAAQAVIAIDNARLLTEQREALDQQTATAEVLQVINLSPGDIVPVFETILEKAHALCGVAFGSLQLHDGEKFRAVAVHGLPQALADSLRAGYAPCPTHPVRLLLAGEDSVQVPDMAGLDGASIALRSSGLGTALFVALRKDDLLLGQIVAARDEIRPFTDKETSLLQSFAQQAVIAMENARLLGELHQRTDDLAESLEYQTATSEVLEVIGRSTSDIQPVLDKMLSAALRLCRTESGGIAIRQSDGFRYLAILGWNPEADKAFRSMEITPGRGTVAGRALAEGRVVQVEDVASDPEFERPDMARLSQWHTALGVPLMQGGRPIGAIAITRDRIEPFTERQIALVKTFADQAVIAMENARLLGELRESLDQQTATSDVLRTIGRSSIGLESVLQTLVETVARLCRADQAYMFRSRGELHHLVASYGISDQALDFINAHPFAPDKGTTSGRVALHRKTIHIRDVLEDPDYSYSEGQKVAGFRTMLGIPLMADDKLVGVFVASRTEVEPFSEKEIALASGFADQAVIAIENARLFEELRDREAELSVTFNNMGDGVAMFDADQRLAAWNRNFQEMLDVTDAFLATRPALDDYVRLLVERGEFGQTDFATELARLRGKFNTQWATERTRPDGRIIGVRNNPVPGGGAVLIYSDITDRKKAEAEIAAARDAAEAALERQTATADILGVISRSPTDARPVFEAIARNAHRLCNAVFCGVVRYDGEWLHLAAVQGFSPDEERDLRSKYPVRAEDPSVLSARVVTSGRAQHIDDILTDKDYDHQHVSIDGFRRIFGVPMLRDGNPIGAIVVGWREQGATPQSQINLLTTFAAQAVIAVENVRLFTELRESLEQQTATGEILRVIAQSPTDVKPVLDAVANAALRFCGANDVQVCLREGEKWFVAVHLGPLGSKVGERRILDRQTGPGRAITDGKTVHLADVQGLDPVEFAEARKLGTALGFNSALCAPMMRDEVAIGAISLRRPQTGSFSERQIALLESFAAQAVIAIENVRLFTELRESLEQQTATADILKVIASSPNDVQPVFDVVVKATVRLCGAQDSMVVMRDGSGVVFAAHEGPLGSDRGTRWPLDRENAMGRAIIQGQTIHIPDASDLGPGEFTGTQQGVIRYGFKAIVAAPLMRDGRAIGALLLRKPEPGPFAPQQIELLETVAAQAVIAIENVRLFTELREALEQQTATAEILRVISRSPTDVQPVLEAVTRAALRFCGAPDAIVLMRDGDENVVAAHEGTLGATLGLRRPITANFSGQALLEGRTLQIADVDDLDPVVYSEVLALAKQHKWRASTAAPMMHGGKAIGCVVLRKPEPGLLSPRQIALLETFAAQAVIAIENVRLFTELRDSLERLKSAQANLIQAEKMASLGQLTAGIAHEIKNPLNFVNNFASLSSELIDELKQAVDPLLGVDEDKRAELQETMDLLTGNLAKILEHGRRADGIVKSMLAHSRGGTGDWQTININGLVEEALNLAYHGARAQDQGFNVTLESEFDPALTPIDVVPQDVTRVFLNLFANGFYAIRKRQRENDEVGYQPALKVSTRDLSEAVEIRVHDNGIGISSDVRAKLFQPFFTTKPTGEGTGLGLSISYDIVTQQHGGAIEVESKIGQFSEFIVRLPRVQRAATPAESKA